jgi:hypothetical protein
MIDRVTFVLLLAIVVVLLPVEWVIERFERAP